MTAVLEERRSARADGEEVGERIAASLEVIARELALIRAHLEETEGKTAALDSGPWLRRHHAG